MVNGFEQAAGQAIVMNAWTSVVMCDLDNFKDVNDTHGHGGGDMVLRTAAWAMQRELRAFDSVYRIGGDEFVILLPGLELDDAVQVADRLRRAVAAGRDGKFGITVSAGVAAARGECRRPGHAPARRRPSPLRGQARRPQPGVRRARRTTWHERRRAPGQCPGASRRECYWCQCSVKGCPVVGFRNSVLLLPL